jgi:hypothetical protein|tara:strand:- start:4618 stop:5061 length:444 start_codon:yes stop_codon:yes gene_type:complete
MTKFIFEITNKRNWDGIEGHAIGLIKKATSESIQDFSIIIDKHSPKRSSKQLSGYWVLINICKDFMNERGDNLTSEEVSYYFKIKAGHYNLIDGVKIARSISNKSDTTREDMQKIIHCIMEFGVDNDIQDCHLEPRELRDMLNYFRR